MHVLICERVCSVFAYNGYSSCFFLSSVSLPGLESNESPHIIKQFWKSVCQCASAVPFFHSIFYIYCFLVTYTRYSHISTRQRLKINRRVYFIGDFPFMTHKQKKKKNNSSINNRKTKRKRWIRQIGSGLLWKIFCKIDAFDMCERSRAKSVWPEIASIFVSISQSQSLAPKTLFGYFIGSHTVHVEKYEKGRDRVHAQVHTLK